MPATTENQLPIVHTTPADLSAVTVTTGGTYYMAGYSNGPGSSTLGAAVLPGATTLTVASATSFYQGEVVLLDGGTSSAELAFITNIAGTTFTVQTFAGAGLITGHASGANIVGTSAGFTPQYTGRLYVGVTGNLTSNNTGDTMNAKLVYRDATAAAGSSAGGTAAGTVIGNVVAVVALTGVLTQGFSIEAFTGASGASGTSPSGAAALTVGKPYWFDLQVTTTTSAKTVQPKGVAWTIQEY